MSCLRLPDGFISYATSMMVRRMSPFRCSFARALRQMSAKIKKSLRFRPNQRKPLEVRHDSPCQIRNGPRLILVSPIRARIPNRATPEKGMDLLEQIQVSLIEREGERRPGLDPDLQLPPETEGYGETAFALREARDKPWVQHGTVFDLHRNSVPPLLEGTSDRRIVQRDCSPPHLSFRISRYGVNTAQPRHRG